MVGLLLMAGCAKDGPTLDEGVDGESGGQSGTETADVNVLPENLIDDLEDGDDEIIEAADRSGSWYTFNDGTSGGSQTPLADSTFSPSEGGAEESSYAARTTGNGFADWGAGMGLDLNGAAEEGELKGTVDASSTAGLAFWAKGNVNVSVRLVVDEVLSADLGGLCVAAEGADCDDTHGTTVALTDEWQHYAVAFSDVAQGGWGKAVSFDATKLVSIHFLVDPGEEFDVAVDDLGFYTAE